MSKATQTKTEPQRTSRMQALEGVVTAERNKANAALETMRRVEIEIREADGAIDDLMRGSDTLALVHKQNERAALVQQMQVARTARDDAERAAQRAETGRGEILARARAARQVIAGARSSIGEIKEDYERARDRLERVVPVAETQIQNAIDELEMLLGVRE